MNQGHSPWEKKLKALLEILTNRKGIDSNQLSQLIAITPTIIKLDEASIELEAWVSLIKHPCVILILGNRGSGKSALGYKFLEYLRYTADLYVVGLPRKARRLLPEWVGVVPTLADLPPHAIALIDESYMLFHSRSSTSSRTRMLSNLINLSRQREQTLIFVSQESRQVDMNIASSANVIIFKNPGILQLEFERKQLSKIAAEAHIRFAVVGKDKNSWCFVYAPESNVATMMQNSLPSFWTPGLSNAYTDANLIDEISAPKKMTREEKIKRAKELHRQGFSLGQIGRILGVSKSTVKNYLDNYPYKRNNRPYSGNFIPWSL